MYNFKGFTTVFTDSHIFADDNGWEVCQQHLGPIEECHSGDSEEEQQWAEFWGTLQKCIHNGTS